MVNKKYERSTDYRKNFFKNNSGLFGSDKYQCVYCGKIRDKKKIQVDHHIPVHKVKKFGLGRILMKIKNINNINSTKNLVPACQKCNQRKGSKMGLWLIKGIVGKHFSWWIFVWLLRLLLLLATLYVVCLIYDGYNIIEALLIIHQKVLDIAENIKNFI